MRTTLGKICVPTETVDPTRKPDAKFRYVDISAVDNRSKKVVAAKTLLGADAPSRARNAVRAGDVIVATTRPNLNAVASISLELDESVCSTGFCVLRPSKDVDADFLFYKVQTPAFVEALTELARGANYPAVSDKQILSQPVELPDLPTQRRLAKHLKSQMTAVEETRRRVEEQAKAAVVLLDKTIVESFLGITPLSVGRDEAAAPVGWSWKSLLELARLESGHTPSRRFPEYWAEGNIPWLALPDIRALDCRTVTQTSERTNALGIANSSARILPAGTVALSRTASVGFVTRFGCEMATSQDFVNWVCRPELHPGYLMWLLRASRSLIRSLSTGAVHQTVYTDVVKQFRICLPDLEEQQRIADRLDENFRLNQQLQNALSTQIEALDKLPGAFLREAFGSL